MANVTKIASVTVKMGRDDAPLHGLEFVPSLSSGMRVVGVLNKVQRNTLATDLARLSREFPPTPSVIDYYGPTDTSPAVMVWSTGKRGNKVEHCRAIRTEVMGDAPLPTGAHYSDRPVG